MSTLALTVNNQKSEQTEYIVQQRSGLTGMSGYIKLDLNSLTYNVQDIPTDNLPLNYAAGSLQQEGDGVPLFGVQNVPNPIGRNIALVAHPCSKTSGLKPYNRKLFIFAVNNGKIDANAKMCSTAEAQLAAVSLQKIPQLPCNDIVVATLDYTTAATVS